MFSMMIYNETAIFLLQKSVYQENILPKVSTKTAFLNVACIKSGTCSMGKDWTQY